MTKKLISIVIPVYQEGENLRDLIERLESITEALTKFDWEYVLINDGSYDDSWNHIKELASESSNITGIDLSRNFGKEITLTAGVEYAKCSDAVICIDADLQHPPELIPELVERWCDGFQVVATIRISTDKEPLIRKIGSRLYYWVMSHISNVLMVSQTTDYGLYDRKVVEAFCRATERGRNFRGIMDWMGFDRTYVEFKADARNAGASSYSYKKLWRLAIISITHFSLWPLQIIGYLGVAITALSGIVVIWMLLNYLLPSPLVYTPIAIVVVANTFLIGIVLIATGLIALYVGAIHTEVINRPLYVIRETVGSGISESIDQ